MHSGATTATDDEHADSVQRLPGDRDVWMFIIGELLMFSALFLAYIVGRAQNIDLYDSSQMLLDQRLGTLNTLLLITSSWAVALAVAAARRGRPAQVPRYLMLEGGLGIGFLAVKVGEYSAKFSAGITMQTNDFFMFYFVLTMVHAAHVVGGSIILIVMWNQARAGRYGPSNMKGLETGASYWHMIDLIWLLMFPLIYLLR